MVGAGFYAYLSMCRPSGRKPASTLFQAAKTIAEKQAIPKTPIIYRSLYLKNESKLNGTPFEFDKKYELDSVTIRADVADNELIDLLEEMDSALDCAGVALNPGK